MIPWKHYIPLDQDLVNISETMQWIRRNPQKVYEIGLNGKEFYDKYLCFECNYEHIYELLYRMALLTPKGDFSSPGR